MVNIIPQQMVNDLNLETVEVAIGMQGVGGHSCNISGVVENCNLTIGQFTGPVHLFVAVQAQECILGWPFLFNYDCTLDYPGDGEFLTFQGDHRRRLTVPISKIGQGSGWNQEKHLRARSAKINQPLETSQPFLWIWVSWLKNCHWTQKQPSILGHPIKHLAGLKNYFSLSNKVPSTQKLRRSIFTYFSVPAKSSYFYW